MDEHADPRLIALMMAGDQHAFGRLVERYQPMAWHLATRLTGEQEIAYELVQDAIVQAYLSLEQLRDTTSTPGPLSFTLTNELLQASGSELEEVRFESLKDEILYAIIRLRHGKSIKEVEARASDALALAAQAHCRLSVADDILNSMGLDLAQGQGKPNRNGPITGTQEWSECEAVLDVPQECVRLSFGIVLAGAGQVWLDQVQLTPLDQRPAPRDIAAGLKVASAQGIIKQVLASAQEEAYCLQSSQDSTPESSTFPCMISDARVCYIW